MNKPTSIVWPPQSRAKLAAICRKHKPHHVPHSQETTDVSAAYQRSGFAEVLAELSQERAQATGLKNHAAILANTLDYLGIPHAESLVERARLALDLGNQVMDELQQEHRRHLAADVTAKRRSQKLQTQTEPIRRMDILERDGPTCYLCGRPVSPTNFPLEHVIPLSKGGTHTADNVRIACAPCNLDKAATMPSEATRYTAPQYEPPPGAARTRTTR